MPHPPIGSETIAIILGASKWPFYNSLDDSDAFTASAHRFRSYLVSPSGLALPSANVKCLFDCEHQPGPLLADITSFIKEREESGPISDVIFYYVGHGAYLDERQYFLALRSTSKAATEATALKMSYLVDVMRDHLLNKRNLVILDACYSGAALIDFSTMADVNPTKLISTHLEDNLPREGTVLLCAAGARKWAKAPVGAELTMFSGALLSVLETGDPHAGEHLTLSETSALLLQNIKSRHGQKGVLPQIHVPVQDTYPLLNTLYFPNPAFTPATTDSRLRKLEDDIALLVQAVTSRVPSGFNDREAITMRPEVMRKEPNAPEAIAHTQLTNIVRLAENLPNVHKELAITALQECYGSHTTGNNNIINFLVDNIIDGICQPDGISVEGQVSHVTIRQAKIPNYIEWEETKSYYLKAPTGRGEHNFRAETRFQADSINIISALDDMSFVMSVGGRKQPLFDFKSWWSANTIGSAVEAFDEERDGASISFDGRWVSFNCARTMDLCQEITYVKIHERSFLPKTDCCFSLVLSKPTFGLLFSMGIEGLEGWMLKRPLIGAKYYHSGADDAAEIDMIHPRLVSARVPGWVLPGLALVIEWSSGA